MHVAQDEFILSCVTTLLYSPGYCDPFNSSILAIVLCNFSLNTYWNKYSFSQGDILALHLLQSLGFQSECIQFLKLL